MPVNGKLLWVTPIALSLALFVAPLSPAGPQPPVPPESPKPRPGVEVEVKYVDDSVMKLKLHDEKLELVTKYGVLQIAITDIRRIEFAPRVPADVAEKVVIAISKLGHSDF